jgi:hypothetical protein
VPLHLKASTTQESKQKDKMPTKDLATVLRDVTEKLAAKKY